MHARLESLRLLQYKSIEWPMVVIISAPPTIMISQTSDYNGVHVSGGGRRWRRRRRRRSRSRTIIW